MSYRTVALALALSAQTSSAFASSEADTLAATGREAPRADDDHDHDHDHDRGEGHDHDHRFDLGGSAGLVYLLGEKEFAFGMHWHGLVTVGEGPWALGLGYERLFDEHAHNTVGAMVQYRITHRWSVNVSPGIAFSGEDPGHVVPAGHMETAYEFVLGPMHLGPAAEVAFDPEDVHFTVGVHLGFGF